MKQLVIIIAIILAYVNADATQKLNVSLPFFPPLTNIVEGKLKTGSGPTIEFVKQIMKNIKNLYGIDMPYEMWVYPPIRNYHNLNLGKANVSIDIKTKNLKDVLYSSVPVGNIEFRLYTIRQPTPEKISDIFGKKLLVLRGAKYGPYLKVFKNPNYKIKMYVTNNFLSGLRMLKANRADYLAGYSTPVKQAQKVMGRVKGLKSKSVFKVDIFFVVSKKTPKAKDILAKLEKSYLDLDEKGEIVDGLKENR